MDSDADSYSDGGPDGGCECKSGLCCNGCGFYTLLDDHVCETVYDYNRPSSQVLNNTSCNVADAVFGCEVVDNQDASVRKQG